MVETIEITQQDLRDMIQELTECLVEESRLAHIYGLTNQAGPIELDTARNRVELIVWKQTGAMLEDAA